MVPNEESDNRWEQRERLTCALPDQLKETARQARWQFGWIAVLIVIVATGLFLAIPYQDRYANLLLPPVILVVTLALQHRVYRRLQAATRVFILVANDQSNDWLAIDGNAKPAESLDEARERVGDRSDDLSSSVLLAWRAASEGLSQTGTQALETKQSVAADVEHWRPTDPVYLARRARLVSLLAYLDGIDDLGPARAAVDAIPEPGRRIRERARLCLEEARRRAFEGGDGLEPIVRISREVRRVALPALSPAARRARRRGRLWLASLVIVAMAVEGLLVVAKAAPSPGVTIAGNYVTSWAGSGLENSTSDGTAFGVIEDAASRSEVVSGSLGADDIIRTIKASLPVEIMCMHDGLTVQSQGIPGGQIWCIGVLVGAYQRDGQEQALVSTEPLSGPTLTVYVGGTAMMDYTGDFPTTAYLVNLPSGTMAQLLAVIHPTVNSNAPS